MRANNPHNVYAPRNPGRRASRLRGTGCLLLIALITITAIAIPVYNNYRQHLADCSEPLSTRTVLNMYYGSEKEEWINDVVTDFNNSNTQICVHAVPVGSGQSMQQIVDGSIQPDIWSPAGSVWLSLLNAQWRLKHNSDIVATDPNNAPSLVSSPVVIAMWKPQAEALGWPNKPIGWSDIVALSSNPRGWAAYGHPEWGTFKFGHTHPDYSNSGLDAVIAENYAAVHKVQGLTTEDVYHRETRAFVSNAEQAVIHYGESTGFFADAMFQKGPSYLSATVMYESLVVEANMPQRYPHLDFPVVAIYPKEGTFNSDHPFVIPQASWVTPARRAAALQFRSFLLAPQQQRKAMQYGFRSSNPTIEPIAPLDTAHGIDRTQPRSLLPVPSANVVQAVQASWEETRHKVDVMLILDHSGSMDGEKIDGARKGMELFVDQMSNQDRLGITIFSDEAQVITPLAELGPMRPDVQQRIEGIYADGGTRLFDTINEQVEALQHDNTTNIRAVVVLTDGQDNVSHLSLDQLISSISPTGDDAGKGIKVFTIAYGSDADVGSLTRIATATGGQEYAGNPQNIRDVYQQISEFF